MTDDDALMYAITGEPAPDTPELRAAQADIATLREQLALIADELDATPGASRDATPGASRDGTPGTDPGAHPGTDPGATPVVVPFRRRPSRGRPLLVAVAAAGVLGLLGGGLALLPDIGDAKSDTSSARDQAAASAAEGTVDPEATTDPDPGPVTTPRGQQGPLADPAYLACVTTIVEGTVSVVRPLAGGRTAVTVRVTRAYKPVPGPKEVTLTFAHRVDVAQGALVLVTLRAGSSTPDDLVVGSPGITAQRPDLTRALAEPRTPACGG